MADLVLETTHVTGPRKCTPPVVLALLSLLALGSGLSYRYVAPLWSFVGAGGHKPAETAFRSGSKLERVACGGGAAPPHTLLSLTGGAIGQGLPCAAGAALACPDRKVIAFQADGSAQYTLQALFTLAREGLDVVILLCSNRNYRILQVELARSGVQAPGPQAQALTSLESPPLDWCALAKGYGVPGTRVETSAAMHRELCRALEEPGPHLLEPSL